MLADLYDFSLSVGDSMFSGVYTFVIDSVDTITYKGVPRRTIYNHVNANGYLYQYDVWMEGIGSSIGPLGIWSLAMGPCHYSVLCEVSENSVVKYPENNGSGDSCLQFNSIPEVFGSAYLSPNPVSTFLIIQLSSPPTGATYFQLYDALGRQVKREEIISTNTTINRNNLPSGIYFWQLEQANKILERGKVVVE